VKQLLCFTSPSSVAVSGVFVYIFPAGTFRFISFFISTVHLIFTIFITFASNAHFQYYF